MGGLRRLAVGQGRGGMGELAVFLPALSKKRGGKFDNILEKYFNKGAGVKRFVEGGKVYET